MATNSDDENMDVNLARELTKLNFDKACEDTYSEIVACITRDAKQGLSESVVNIVADENILAWLDEKLSDKGFGVQWYLDEDNELSVCYIVKWYEECRE